MLIFKRMDYYHKIKKNLKKLSKDISMRDHSKNKKIPKKCTLLNVSKPRVIIPQENKQNKKNL
jgi:hypothetical protein